MPLLCHKNPVVYILDVMNSVSDICIFNRLLLWLVSLF